MNGSIRDKADPRLFPRQSLDAFRYRAPKTKGLTQAEVVNLLVQLSVQVL